MPKQRAARASVQQQIRVMYFTNADHQDDRRLVYKPAEPVTCEIYLRTQSFSLASLLRSYTNYAAILKPKAVMRDVCDL